MSQIEPNPRKIVLIIGNGYDLDLGLKTSYKDFWESPYCPKDYPSPLIRHLNNRWEKDIDKVRWYDLENELLAYVKEGDKTDIINEEERSYLKDNSNSQLYIKRQYSDIDELFSSLTKKGIILLARNGGVDVPYRDDLMQSVLWRDKHALQLIKESLCKYLISLEKTSPKPNSIPYHLLLSLIKSSGAGNSIDIFTFNYTPFQSFGRSLRGINIYYMHGSYDSYRIIIGTRDDLSISNEYDFIQKAMDDSFSPPGIVPSLNEADELIIFGHSLGENDRQYFAPFFRKQANVDNHIKKDITIFTKDHQSVFEIKRALQRMTEGNLSSFFSNNLPIFIKTANIEEDQKLMYDFLINHYYLEEHAEAIIETLLKKNSS